MLVCKLSYLSFTNAFEEGDWQTIDRDREREDGDKKTIKN